MTQANRNLVADALESGEFAQGKGALCRGKKYCCLGVACEIYQRHVGDLKIITGANLTSYDKEVSDLPGKVKEWLGFTTTVGDFGEGHSLAGLNDNGVSFTEIARLFREPPGGLCTS